VKTPRLPSDTERTVVVGRTGSGKTQAAVYLLSRMRFDLSPWIIVDYKNDDLINAIEGVELVTYESDLKKLKPGIYILKVMPGDEDLLDEFFFKVWEVENIGIYVDEGYLIGQNNRGFNTCLTQGRSKHIPMITLTQRPVYLSRYVFSEASFFWIFDLIDDRDWKTVKEYVKTNKLDEAKKKYESVWYDVGEKKAWTLFPVPDAGATLEVLNSRLAALRKRRVRTL
jgi:hypothetical protein